ncbi:ankyrin repeat-containing protein [Acanthamoeba castellanii mimivirus]|nr:ankyrin repeat-containing protein [Acanthamoeba castellanii mimivirus]BAV63014.1 ankyrin repeat-containing protein [Acanthamoeba castellanii mimivirus]
MNGIDMKLKSSIPPKCIRSMYFWFEDCDENYSLLDFFFHTFEEECDEYIVEPD